VEHVLELLIVALVGVLIGWLMLKTGPFGKLIAGLVGLGYGGFSAVAALYYITLRQDPDKIWYHLMGTALCFGIVASCKLFRQAQ